MAEKDITEKILADYNDVFADIINVLLFKGEQVISPDDLESTSTKSQYKADGKIHELERDVSKLVKSGNTTISLIGLENQTQPDRFMPARIFSYDGQSYRAQLLTKDSTKLYPSVTLVLYFGFDPWNYGKRMSELMDIPEKFQEFISDYEMKNLFEIAFLSPEQVKLFHSDFRYVADYLVQKRMTNDYTPSPDVLQHVDETLKLITVLTGDTRFEEAATELPPKGGISMCDVLDRVESKGIAKGISQGISQGIAQGKSIGEERLGSLITAMVADHSGTDAVVRVSTDPEYRREMYMKYGIL